MTTILGIKTSGDEEGIVLAADSQMTFGPLKSEISKIWTDKHHAVGHAGNADKYLDSFFSYLSGNRDFRSFLKFVFGEKRKPQLQELLLSFSQPSRQVRKRMLELTGSKAEPKSKVEEIVRDGLRGEGRNLENETDRFFTALLRNISDQSHPIEKAIRRGYFEEFGILNGFYTKRCELENVESEATELLVATNVGTPGLYRVNPFGVVEPAPEAEEFEYLCLGSGSDIVIEYLSKR
ncbi:MAG: hypothetical protein AB1668_02500 [Nanoarchaeota archaeon]